MTSRNCNKAPPRMFLRRLNRNPVQKWASTKVFNYRVKENGSEISETQQMNHLANRMLISIKRQAIRLGLSQKSWIKQNKNGSIPKMHEHKKGQNEFKIHWNNTLKCGKAAKKTRVEPIPRNTKNEYKWVHFYSWIFTFSIVLQIKTLLFVTDFVFFFNRWFYNSSHGPDFWIHKGHSSRTSCLFKKLVSYGNLQFHQNKLRINRMSW